MKNTIIRSGLETLYFSGLHHWMRPLVGGVGTILTLHHVRPPRSSRFQPNRLLEISLPDALSKYVARKGSVAVNGVSLTVNAVSGSRFAVNLIPHTLASTTLGSLARGARVNVEVDMMARYAERLAGAGP